MRTDSDPISRAFHKVYDAMVDAAPAGPTWEQITDAQALPDTHPLDSRRVIIPRPSWRRRAMVTVAASLATLLAVGGTLLALRSGSDPEKPVGSEPPVSLAPPVSEPAAPEPAVTDVPQPPSSITIPPATAPAATVEPPEASPPENWTSIELDASGFELGFEDVVAGPDGYVAVGLAGAGTSSDGVVWDLASANVAATQVTAGDGVFLAFDRSRSSAALWVSPDGATWTEVALDDEVFTNGVEISAVVSGEGRFVAVGSDFGGEGSPVWTSSDGVTWTRVPHDESVFGGEMLDLAYGDSGYVAVGRISGGEGWAEAAVWTSSDGTTWSRITNEKDVFGGVGGHVMYGVAFAGGRYVAVGVEGDPDIDSFGWHAAVWTSTDGVNWTRIPHNEEVFGFGNQEVAVGMNAVAYGAAGYVAVGDAIALDEGNQSVAAVWYSPNGRTWYRAVPDDAVPVAAPGLNGVAAIGSNWVAIGRDLAISWTWE